MNQARSSVSAAGSGSSTRVQGKSSGTRRKDLPTEPARATKQLIGKSRVDRIISEISATEVIQQQSTLSKNQRVRNSGSYYELRADRVDSIPKVDAKAYTNALRLAAVQSRDNPVAQIREGYDYASITQLADAFDTTMEATISVLGLPRSTIKRKKTEDQPLSAAISDQIYRANRVFARCMDLFGEKDAANRWLQREHLSLNGATPLSLLDTTAGYEMVLDELERINNGVPV